MNFQKEKNIYKKSSTFTGEYKLSILFFVFHQSYLANYLILFYFFHFKLRLFYQEGQTNTLKVVISGTKCDPKDSHSFRLYFSNNGCNHYMRFCNIKIFIVLFSYLDILRLGAIVRVLQPLKKMFKKSKS